MTWIKLKICLDFFINTLLQNVGPQERVTERTGQAPLTLTENISTLIAIYVIPLCSGWRKITRWYIPRANIELDLPSRKGEKQVMSPDILLLPYQYTQTIDIWQMSWYTVGLTHRYSHSQLYLSSQFQVEISVKQV